MQRARHAARAAGPARETLNTLPSRNGVTAYGASIAIGPSQAYLHQDLVRGVPKIPGVAYIYVCYAIWVRP